MTGERLSGIDQGTLLAERLLGDVEVLRRLLAGGQEKELILQQVTSELKDDSVGQAGFLRTLFRNIAREGDVIVTNRRDAALEILTDDVDEKVHLTQAMIPFVETNPTVVHDAYIEAVQQQTRENDPISGSLAALLAVGKAIAPYLPQETQREQQIIGEWEKVVEQFPTFDERFYIRSKIEEIKTRSSNLIFDAQVKQLRNAGLDNATIAQLLGVPKFKVEQAVRRLLKAGEITPQRLTTEDITRFDVQVRQLRNAGLDNATVAQLLGVPKFKVGKAVSRLLNAGEITPQRLTTKDITRFDVQVRQLRNAGLDNATIAQLLGVPESRVKMAVRRLLKAGEITPQRRGWSR